jgi:hypothetical protein
VTRLTSRTPLITRIIMAMTAMHQSTLTTMETMGISQSMSIIMATMDTLQSMSIIMAMTAMQQSISITIIVAKKATSKIIITMMTSNIIVN